MRELRLEATNLLAEAACPWRGRGRGGEGACTKLPSGDAESAKADRWGQPPAPSEARERAAVAGLTAGLCEPLR